MQRRSLQRVSACVTQPQKHLRHGQLGTCRQKIPISGLPTIRNSDPRVLGRERSIHHLIRIRASLYVRFKDTPVQMEITYSLTLLRFSNAFAYSGAAWDQRMVDIGWCKTRTNDARTSVQLSCLQPGLVPNCGTVFSKTLRAAAQPVRSARGMHSVRRYDRRRCCDPLRHECAAATRQGWRTIRWMVRSWRMPVWSCGCTRRSIIFRGVS